MAKRKVITLGPTRGQYTPGYEVYGFRDGDPRRRIRNVNWRSIVAIQTTKAIGDIAGTFTITLKDKRTRQQVREMDVLRIRLRGHTSDRLITVLKAVVDEVRPVGSADPYGASEDTVITGRCVAKYLQVTSLFLPVWDPEANLPTALTFGYGDAAKKVDGNRPFDINRYLVKRFTYGDRRMAGVSGIPNSRYWLDHYTRFARRVDFRVPFMQFDEVSVADSFKQMEVVGFTEAWVDELGRQVYRQPPWDAPVAYRLSTSEFKQHALPRGDMEVATYVEVIPAADPGIDTTTAQALRAGRAPVPSAYLGAGDTTLAGTVDKSFIIDTDSRGRVTAEGRRNPWYRYQRRMGLRPQQVTSPLLATQEQAQRQAEGLLRFYARATKGIQATIPGTPELRLGYNVHVHGELEGVPVSRVFYIEQISHDYHESPDGGEYTTTFVGTHGRDRTDPKWTRIVLPRFDPEDLIDGGGILDPGDNGADDNTVGPGADGIASGTPKQIIDRVVLPIARAHEIPIRAADVDAANGRHGPTVSGGRSDHQGPPEVAWAVDISNGSAPTPQMDAIAAELAKVFDIPWNGSGAVSRTHNGYRYQLIYRSNVGGNHYNHVHFGIRKVG